MEFALIGFGIVAFIGWIWFCWNHPVLAMLLSLLNIFSE